MAKKTSKRALRSALERLPKEIDDTYDEAMQRIQDQDEEETDLALRTLMRISFALRPLSTIEIRHALAIEPSQTDFDPEALVDEETLLFICAGLVTIDDESRVFRLVHFTTQKYFKNTSHKHFPLAHQKISETCLTYLCFDCFDRNFVFEYDNALYKDISAFLQKYPFLEYVAHNWGYHVQKDEKSVSQPLLRFLKDDLKIKIASHLLFLKHAGTFNFRGANGFHIATYFDLKYTMTALINDGIDVDVSCDKGERALHWAARSGHEDLIQFLLDNGAEVEAKTQRGMTALHFAAVSGSKSVVHALLKNGADLESRSSFGDSPLALAVYRISCEVV